MGRSGTLPVLLLLGVMLPSFLALGTWQLQRRTWKHALIAQVSARVHAAAAPLPDSIWTQIDGRASQYLHVTLLGRYLPGHDVRVQAVTVFGPGYWVMSPLRGESGRQVLINRGFVPALAGHPVQPVPQGLQAVTGLLRATEPGGAFLHHNDPVGGRWYSRDVLAIARAERLGPIAPFFVDVEAGAPRALDPLREGITPLPSAEAAGAALVPTGGLTVLQFSDNHLVYALTWFALGFMSAAAAWWVRRATRAASATGNLGE